MTTAKQALEQYQRLTNPKGTEGMPRCDGCGLLVGGTYVKRGKHLGHPVCLDRMEGGTG